MRSFGAAFLKQHNMKKLITVAGLSLAAAALTALAYGVSSIPREASSGNVMVRQAADKKLPENPFELPENHIHRQAAPARMGSTGSSIYGYMSYYDDPDFYGGMYELSLNGDCSRLWDYDYAVNWVSLTNGWLRNGRLCGLAVMTFGSEDQLWAYAYQEYDLLSGEELLTRDIDYGYDLTPYFYAAAYNPLDDRIYGYGKKGASSDATYCFKSAPATRPEETVVVKQLDFPGDRCYSFCWSQADKCFYGVTTQGSFVRVTTEGESTELFQVPVEDLANSKGALTVSPNDGCLIWQPVCYSNKAYLYKILPEAKTCEMIHQYDVDRQFTFFVSPDDVADPTVPAAPNVETEFSGNSLEGTVSFTLPEVSLDGNLLSGNLAWKLFDNGNEIESGNGESGETVQLQVNVAQGEHTFSVRAIAGELLGYPGVASVYVGNDVPCAPEDVMIENNMISWTPVTQGVHDGYLDPAEIMYKVYLNDEEVGETANYQMPVGIDEDKLIAAYVATVVAVFEGLESKPGVSEKALLGRPFPLPMTIEPVPHDEDLVTILNNDEGPEYGVWTMRFYDGYYYFDSGWGQKPCDDWLIMPPAEIPSNEVVYEVAIDAAKGGYTSRNEYFEVWAGTEPTVEAMTIPVISKTRAQDFYDFKEYSGKFAVPRAGTYYIAVRGCSDADQKALLVRNIRLRATDETAEIPAAVSNLQIESLNDAELNMVLSFDMPTEFISGNKIEGTVKAIAYGASEAVAEGEPGSHQQLVVPTSQGENYVKVVTFFEEREGQYAEVSGFTGMDMLGWVREFEGEVSEDNMSVSLSWLPPVESLNGGYISDKDINYWVGPIYTDGSFIGDPILAGTDVTEYTYQLPEGSAQEYVRIGIAAENAAGISNARSFVARVIGEPYKLPVDETFADMEVHYNPVVASAPSSAYNDGGWTWCQPELVDPDYYNPDSAYGLIGYTDAESARVRLALPKVSTVGEETPVAVFNVWTGKGAASDIAIYATTYRQDSPAKIATIPAGSGWQKVEMALPAEYLGHKWMNLYIDGYLPSSENYLILCGYQILPVSGLKDLTELPAGHVAVLKGKALLAGFEGEAYEVFSADGKRLASGKADSGFSEINLPAGICVLKIGEKSYRLLIP